MLVLFLQLKKEGTNLSMLLCNFLWLCQENNGLKSCQSYNEIMEMDCLPVNMPESRMGNREFIWSDLMCIGGIASKPLRVQAGQVHGRNLKSEFIIWC